MPTNKGWVRPDPAKIFHSFEKMSLDGADKQNGFPATINDSDWTVLTNTSYTDKEDSTTTVVTSGLFMKYADTVGILYSDTEDGETGMIYTSGRYFAPLNTGETPAVGDKMIWDVSTEKFSNLAGIAGDVLCATAIGAAVTLAAANTQRLPAGDYIEIELLTSQTVV